MNGCSAVQAKFTEYLDGRLNGREMQLIAAHLEDCRACAREWTSLAPGAGFAGRAGPGAGAGRSAAADSRGREPGAGAQPPQHLTAWNLAWKNTVGPFLLQASAGFASAVLLLGTVIVLVTMFAHPEMAQASQDEPLGNPTAPRLVTFPAVWATTDWRHLRPGGGGGLYQRRRPDIRLPHRLRTHRRSHPRADRESAADQRL